MHGHDVDLGVLLVQLEDLQGLLFGFQYKLFLELVKSGWSARRLLPVVTILGWFGDLFLFVAARTVQTIGVLVLYCP